MWVFVRAAKTQPANVAPYLRKWHQWEKFIPRTSWNSHAGYDGSAHMVVSDDVGNDGAETANVDTADEEAEAGAHELQV